MQKYELLNFIPEILRLPHHHLGELTEENRNLYTYSPVLYIK